jgi:hypothetical protein
MTEKGYATRIMKVTLPLLEQSKESSENAPSAQETVIGLWIPNSKVDQVSETSPRLVLTPLSHDIQIRAQIKKSQETESAASTKRSSSTRA